MVSFHIMPMYITVMTLLSSVIVINASLLINRTDKLFYIVYKQESIGKSVLH